MPSSLQEGYLGLSRFRGIWGEKSPKKEGVQSGPKDASSAYLFFIGLGSPSWYPFRVPTSVYIEIIGPGWDAGPPPPPSAISPAHRSKMENFFAHWLA